MSSSPWSQHRSTGRIRRDGRQPAQRRLVQVGEQNPAPAVATAGDTFRLLPGERTLGRRIRFAVVCMVTLSSLTLGMLAVLLAFRGEVIPAAFCLVACVPLDGVDGGLARKLGVTSPFGAQLDSTADMGSFGLATAVVGYASLADSVPPIVATVACVLVAACAALRLARFNVVSDDAADFHGLPTAMVAGATAVAVLADPPVPGYVRLTGLVVLALLMVSGLPYPKMKRLIKLPLWLWAATLTAGAVQPRYSFPAAAIAYLLSGPLIALHRRRRDGRGSRWFWAAALAIPLALLPLGVTDAKAEGTNPVVLVHGLNSEAKKWAPYVGPEGFLATVGRNAFAVGDGQAPGVMRTGSELEALKETNTIAENAEQLREYIAGVKEKTGASRVDLVAHSMGGLVARYYIDRLMDERDVDRLIMLGTPNGGSPCAVLPAKLGLSVPATVELRPSYVRDVFNQQIRDRKGTAFFALAGNPLTEALRSPCAGTPSDLVVSVDSVEAVGVTAQREPLLHNDLRSSRAVFDDFVAPALASDVVPANTSNGAPSAAAGERQTVALADGHVPRGGFVEQVLNIDDVAVATFAVYDPTRSLTVSVRGASGKTINLTAADNGFIKVDDPETLLSLGYGFTNPAPGPWRVTMRSTGQTPAAGADFAVSAQVEGGATLSSRISELLPTVGQEVSLSAVLEDKNVPVVVQQAVALIRAPDGTQETVPLTAAGLKASGTWRPKQAGLHSIDLAVAGMTADETRVERTSFLVAEVQDAEVDRSLLPIAVIAVVATVLLVVTGTVFAVIAVRRARRRRSREAVQ